MSETRFTPGPWKWETDDGVARLRSEAAIARSSCPDFDGFDPIVDDGSAGGEYGRTIEPDSPNARLIAAAPELYAALEEIANVAHDYPGDAFWYMQNVARSALANARETPATASAPTSPDRKPTEGEPTVTNQERPRHRFINSGNGRCISCGEVEGENHAR